MKKYLVFAGPVRSKNDKQIHRVGGPQLAQLYRVNPSECIFIGWDITDDEVRAKTIGQKNLISLYPDNSGRYELPKGAE